MGLPGFPKGVPGDIDPARLDPDLPSSSILIIDGYFDRVATHAATTRLWEQLGRPKRVSYPSGHHQFGALVPFAMRHVADLVERVCNTREEHRGQ